MGFLNTAIILRRLTDLVEANKPIQLIGITSKKSLSDWVASGCPKTPEEEEKYTVIVDTDHEW